MPTLFIFSGLPGVGKTALARRLAQHHGAVYLRVDTIEQGLRDLCDVTVEGEGYRLAYRLAADNLSMGQDVIADSCNPVTLTRREWERVATAGDGHFINIEVVCSSAVQHRTRVESREADIRGLKLPTWDEVQRREYETRDDDRIVVDTANCSEQEAFSFLLRALQSQEGG